MIHVRTLYRMSAIVGILAMLAGCGGGGDEKSTRAEIEALRTELAQIKKSQEELQKAVQDLQARPARIARADRGQPERDAIRIIPTGKSPRLGNPVGVTVVEFADFQCPFCQAASGLPKALIAKYPNDVQFVFKHYPLARHVGGQLAAQAAWAAHQQGKFWEMHDLIYAGDIRQITPEVLRGYAQQIGLDMERYNADVASKQAAQAVAMDKALGRRIKVPGTPTFFVNGRLVRERTPAAVEKAVADEIARVKQKRAS